MVIRLGMRFHVVWCRGREDQIHPVSHFNHWGLTSGTRAEVDDAHQKAIENKKNTTFDKLKSSRNARGVFFLLGRLGPQLVGNSTLSKRFST
jgi:hypothetical protein